MLRNNCIRKIVVSIVICSMIAMQVSATGALGVNTNQSSRELVVYKEKLNEIRGSEQINISKVKTAADFNGKIYTIIECSPTGYMIYNNDTAIFVEYALDSPSPYLNYNDSLYYGGPTNYYQLNDGEFVHTIDNQENFSDKGTSAASEISERLYNNLNSKKDLPTLDYVINGGYYSRSLSSVTDSNVDTISSSSYSTNATVAYGSITHPDFYENLTRFGYWEGDSRCPGGCCGYVGLNMLIAYYDKYKNDNIMDDCYWYKSNKTLLKSGDSSLTKDLFNIDPKDSTTSMHIHKVCDEYCASWRGMSVDTTSLYAPLFNDNTIMSKIDNDIPVELFGNLHDASNSGSSINHAVVAYRYYKSDVYGNRFTVHYGWPGYTAVSITDDFDLLGSIFCIN